MSNMRPTISTVLTRSSRTRSCELLDQHPTPDLPDGFPGRMQLLARHRSLWSIQETLHRRRCLGLDGACSDECAFAAHTFLVARSSRSTPPPCRSVPGKLRPRLLHPMAPKQSFLLYPEPADSSVGPASHLFLALSPSLQRSAAPSTMPLQKDLDAPQAQLNPSAQPRSNAAQLPSAPPLSGPSP